MFTESKYTNTVLDAISSYVATALSTNEQLLKDDCLKYISEKTNFSISEIDEAFGEVIEDEIIRNIAKCSADIDEATIEDCFSKTLLTEEDALDVKDKVDAAEKKQKYSNSNANTIDGQAALDKQQRGHNTRKYFAYINLAYGKMFICSELEQSDGFASNQFKKLGNFLKTCLSPKFSKGILVAPISQQEAKQYLAACKGTLKYLDLTPNTTNGDINKANVKANSAAKDAQNAQNTQNKNN